MKNISIIFFQLLCILSCKIFSSEEIPEYFSIMGISHQKCGTLEDQNYRAAFYALQDTIEFFFPNHFIDASFKRPYFFPDAGEFIRNACDDMAFYYEGSLSWKAQNLSLHSPDNLLCKRIMRKAVQIDVPCSIFEEKDESIVYPPSPVFLEEERTFKLYKDYSSLLSAFCVLQQDLALINESNEAFLHRRLQDFHLYYKSGVYSSIPLRVKDLKEFSSYYKRQRLKNNQRIEEY